MVELVASVVELVASVVELVASVMMVSSDLNPAKLSLSPSKCKVPQLCPPVIVRGRRRVRERRRLRSRSGTFRSFGSNQGCGKIVCDHHCLAVPGHDGLPAMNLPYRMTSYALTVPFVW